MNFSRRKFIMHSRPDSLLFWPPDATLFPTQGELFVQIGWYLDTQYLQWESSIILRADKYGLFEK